MTCSGVAAFKGSLMKMQKANVTQSSSRNAETASRISFIGCTKVGAG